jgi:hypothetical protein
MHVVVAAGVVLTGLGAVLFAGSRKRREARRRILQLATEIDAVAASMEADVLTRPADRALHKLAERARTIAEPARSALRRRRMLVVLPGDVLYAHEDRLHDDHGAIVHLRSQADCCLSRQAQAACADQGQP